MSESPTGGGAVVVCRACSTESAEGSRFCSACGAAIVAPGRRSERRVVTALFCDLVGFTAMSERADPEDVDELLRALGALVREVSASFGGLVEKSIGDAVVAVFGIPVAHEDDPERAVRAGLRILERLSELPRPGGEAVQARVGINTGRALIHLDVDPASGHGFMVGDAVNTAARLQNIAPPMGVVVGEATHGLTAGLFDYRQLAPVELKGKVAPVCPWLARRPLTRTGVEARMQRSELTGRAVELATLVRHVGEILAGGSPRMVLLVGEAGIGKTRLVYELSRYTDGLPELFRWRTGFCQPFGQTTPFRALAQIVQAHAAILESDGVADVERKLDAMLSEAGDRDWLAMRLRPLLGLDAPPAGPEENVAAWERVVEEMAAHGPAILVFEDLHWADEGLLGFLTELIDHVGQVPLLVLATARPEVLERAPSLAAGGRHGSHLPVRNLERRDLERLVRVQLDGAELPADLLHVVSGRCGGNPLYIEEFIQYLSEAGPDVGDGGAPVAPAGLPDTLEALIAARLDVLPRRCREVLGDASVMGLEFWRGAVASLEETGSKDIDRELRELAERELVRALPTSTVEGDAQYVFRHAVIRDVVYEHLPRAVRAAKHTGVARWLEGAAGERLDEVAGILAHHWVTALELSQTVRDEGLAEAALGPAVRSLTRAGDHALALDVTIAERFYRQALELTPTESPERPRLLVRWARALMEDGRMDDALRVFDDGIAGVKMQGDHVATALALGDQSTALQLVGDMERSGQTLQEALALLAGERSAARADLLGRWATHCMVMADEGEAARVADETLAMAAELGMPTPVLALVARASSRCGACDERGFGDYATALAAAGQQGLGRETGIIHFNWAEDIGSLKGPRAALLRFREGLRFAQSRKDRAMSFSLTYGIVRDLFRSGQWAESLDEARALAPRLEAAHNLAELAYLRAVEAGLLVAWGELEEAQSLLPTLEEAALGPGEPILQAGCLVSAAGVHLAMGETDAARRLLARCAGLPGLREEHAMDWHVPGAVRHAAALGDGSLAERLAALAKEGRPLHRRVAPTVRASLCELGGDYEPASRQFAAAAAAWRELGVPYEAALARLGQGRCLLALGRANDAASPLHEAHEALSGLGALPDVEIARALAAKALSA